MGPVQLVAAPVALAASAVTAALVVIAVRRIVRVIRLGKPDPARFTDKGARLRTMLGPENARAWT